MSPMHMILVITYVPTNSEFSSCSLTELLRSRMALFHMVRLSRMVPENRVIFWLTVAMLALRQAVEYCSMGFLSRSTLPLQGW